MATVSACARCQSHSKTQLLPCVAALKLPSSGYQVAARAFSFLSRILVFSGTARLVQCWIGSHSFCLRAISSERACEHNQAANTMCHVMLTVMLLFHSNPFQHAAEFIQSNRSRLHSAGLVPVNCIHEGQHVAVQRIVNICEFRASVERTNFQRHELIVKRYHLLCNPPAPATLPLLL